jgi:hypothetical protein
MYASELTCPPTNALLNDHSLRRKRAASTNMCPAQRYTLNSAREARIERIRSLCSSGDMLSAAASAELASSTLPNNRNKWNKQLDQAGLRSLGSWKEKSETIEIAALSRFRLALKWKANGK